MFLREIKYRNWKIKCSIALLYLDNFSNLIYFKTLNLRDKLFNNSFTSAIQQCTRNINNNTFQQDMKMYMGGEIPNTKSPLYINFNYKYSTTNLQRID